MKYTYSDMAVGLPIARCGNVRLVYDEDCITQSLYLLFATITHERVRNPFGSELVRLLFQPMNETTTKRIKREIVDKITRWEPRVVIRKLTVIEDRDAHSYDVELLYDCVKMGRSGEFRTRIKQYV